MTEEEELGDPFRQAVRFLAPCLAQFGFTPMLFHRKSRTTDSPLPEMERSIMLSIIQHERREELQRATTVYIDWLLQILPLEPDALRPFLGALRMNSRAGPQQPLHDILCVCSIYLDLHRDLPALLAPKLLEGSVQLPVLLAHLTSRSLLDDERAPEILDVARDRDSEEVFARAVTFMLTCLYHRQAKNLYQMYTNADATGIATDSQSTEVKTVYHSDRSDVTARGDVDDVIADVMQEVNDRELNPVDSHPPEAEPDNDVLSSSSSSSSVEAPNGRDPHVPVTLLHEPERWPEVLQQVLDSASQAEGEWPRARPLHELQSLWAAAGDLIQSGLRESRRDTAGDNGLIQSGLGESGRDTAGDNDEGDSDADSDDSRATLRANDVNAKDTSRATTPVDNIHDNLLLHVRGERTKDYVQKMLNVVLDDNASLSSVETNNRQRGRTVGEMGLAVVSGVLREEELRALKEEPIQLRPYQNELLHSARRGHNVLIWLPTGTGKTYIVLKYAEEHLKADPDHRVAFVVPKVRLARQQFERFQAYLPGFHPHLKCGETTGTSSGRQPLGDIIRTSRVVVVTGQSLVEAVERGRVSLGQFSLLVLDECHHTRGGHPLRILMNQYMELKFERRADKLPQVVGLTASPGVGKARGKEVEDAVKYLKQLCARLDVSYICSVRNHVQDLKRYVHEPVSEVKECVKRQVDRLKEHLEDLMEDIEGRMSVDREFEKYLRDASRSGMSEDTMLKTLVPPAGSRGEDQYTQWLSSAEKNIKQIKNPKAFYNLTAHIDLLRLCQRCLMLNEDCDSLGALDLLKEEVNTIRQEKPTGPDDSPVSVEQDLFDLFDKFTQNPSIEKECSSRECQNPKLQHLENLLLHPARDDPGTTAQNEAGEDPDSQETPPEALFRQVAQAGMEIIMRPMTVIDEEDEEEQLEELAKGLPGAEDDPELASTADSSDLWESCSVVESEQDYLEHVRGMIFVRTLDLSKALLRWMRRHPKLRYLNPDRITGVNASVKNGGMTKSEVTEVMSKFNSGDIKVVICTSAAEEGLDFKACNFVIRYLYEASMVSMIQIRGRARDENSKYSVLGSQSTKAKERENVESELAMREAVQRIQRAADADPQTHHETIQRMQREAWSNRWRKDVDERKRLKQRLEPGTYRLLCRKCRLPACSSEDIRILRKTNRVVIGPEFSNKYERKDYHPSEGKSYDERIPRTGKIHCKDCGSYWGILVRSLDDNVEFPVIPIKSFLVENASGDTNIREKWSQAFEVPVINDEDMHRHSEPLLGPQDRLEGDLEPEEPEEDHDRDAERGRPGEPVPRQWGGSQLEKPEDDQGQGLRGHLVEALQNPGGPAGDVLQPEGPDRGGMPQVLNDLNSLSLPSSQGEGPEVFSL